MKTTIDIADDLFQQAKEAARRRKTTLRTLVEAGLRTVLAQGDPAARYAFPDLRTGKRGDPFLPGFDLSHWSQLRSFLYADRMARALPGRAEEAAP